MKGLYAMSTITQMIATAIIIKKHKLKKTLLVIEKYVSFTYY